MVDSNADCRCCTPCADGGNCTLPYNHAGEHYSDKEMMLDYLNPTRHVIAAKDAEIARLKAEVERVTEVARLLVGECEEQRECPVCGTDTNVEVCRPSCYVAKMRKVLDDKKGGG